MEQLELLRGHAFNSLKENRSEGVKILRQDIHTADRHRKKALYVDDIIVSRDHCSWAWNGSERQRRGVSGVVFLHSVPVTAARKAEVAREAQCLRGTTFSQSAVRQRASSPVPGNLTYRKMTQGGVSYRLCR
jgi:hypothetical protein